MAAIKGRKHRQGVSEHVPLYVRVPPDIKTKVDHAAEALGVSASAYLTALMQHEELDERGRPAWWTQSVPRDQQALPLENDEEAPLQRSA